RKKLSLDDFLLDGAPPWRRGAVRAGQDVTADPIEGIAKFRHAEAYAGTPTIQSLPILSGRSPCPRASASSRPRSWPAIAPCAVAHATALAEISRQPEMRRCRVDLAPLWTLLPSWNLGSTQPIALPPDQNVG